MIDSSESVLLFMCVPVLLFAAVWACATRSHADAASGPTLDAGRATPSADGATLWYNALDIGIEGQGWSDVNHPYDRLPARAEGVVPAPVWSLSHHAAGLCCRFVTDSLSVSARWSLRNDSLAMNHMPATGVSGLDLYVKTGDTWKWAAVGRPTAQRGNETILIKDAPSGIHEYMLYLPLYNGVDSVEVGVGTGSILAKPPEYPEERAKPMLFWGTSIVQGGCAARPGMAYPAILGRRMNRPVINLGFSGNGRMDPEVADLIAELDAAVFVIDCAPNMDPALIAERTEPTVHALRKAHPETPIVLVENVPYQQGWFVESRRDAYHAKNETLENAYRNLRQQGITDLYYVPCDALLGTDAEATVDGTHPTDLGFMRMADAIEPTLREAVR